MNKFFFLLTALFLNLFFWGCKDSSPEEIRSGEFFCEHCKMKIMNLKFHSQMVTNKGKRFHFDSSECLLYYVEKNKNKLGKAWVKTQEDAWTEYNMAYYLQAKEIHSPMGENLVAFSNKENAEKKKLELSGKLFTDREITEYLLKKWDTK